MPARGIECINQMKNNFWIRILCLCALAIGVGCSNGGVFTSPPQTRLLFVADEGNSRVLVYNAPFTTGQSATAALGQANFTANAAPNPPTSASMAFPAAVAVDSAGNLYVADSGNCRVLQFNPPFTTGMAATLAVGQVSGATNLTTAACATGAASTATGLGGPAGLAIDSAGNLWVADNGTSRVLKYPAPITAGEVATVTLGQTSTGASLCNQGTGTVANASTLCSPDGLAFDEAGNLWVADSTNSRVLMYPPANLVTGGSATVELGQPAATAFTSTTGNNGGISATSLYNPVSLAFDAAGNLWVADSANSRALMYPKASLATNDAAATVELGQPAGATAFTSGTANNGGIGLSTLAFTYGLAFDSSGRIFVSDKGFFNNRTLVFTPPFTNGMNATLVLGQADFVTDTANTGGESAATQASPVGIATSF